MLSLSLIFGSSAVVYLGIVFFVGVCVSVSVSVSVCVCVSYGAPWIWELVVFCQIGEMFSHLSSHALSHPVISFSSKIPVNTYVRPFFLFLMFLSLNSLLTIFVSLCTLVCVISSDLVFGLLIFLFICVFLYLISLSCHLTYWLTKSY